jgi:hypothetical protein
MAMMMIQTINAKGKEHLNYGNFQMFKLPDEVKHDAGPTSFVGRFWRWHINFCLGCKVYFNNFSAGQGMDMADFPGLPSAFTASFYSGLDLCFFCQQEDFCLTQGESYLCRKEFIYERRMPHLQSTSRIFKRRHTDGM